MPARGGAHDQGDLGDHPGGVGVALEDLRVQTEGDHALLDPRAAALVDAHHGTPVGEGVVEDLTDLLTVDLAEGAAEDGDVLAEHGDRSSVDGPVAGHDAVAVGAIGVQTEVGRTVAGQGVELHEGAGIEQCVDPLPRGHLALGVLFLHGSLGAGVHGFVPASLQVGELARGRVDVDLGRGQRFWGFGGHSNPA